MTGSEVESYIYSQLNNSVIKSTIKGTIYKDGTRLANSDKEDAVIKFAAGLDGLVSTGVAIVNIYVKDIDNGKGQMVKDTARCGVIEKAAAQFIKSLPRSPFRWESDATIQSNPMPDIKQHYVNIRLKYQLMEF